MDNFLFKLLGKRKRRIYILAKWHSSKCIEGERLEDVMKNFMHCILYNPIEITLYPEYLRIFAIPGLHIYYSWLRSDELEFIKEIYLSRKDYFKNCNFFVDKAFRFSGCTATFSIQHRRELVRDFVNMYISIKKETFVLLYVCQQMLLNPKVDRFIVDLHHALQGRFNIKEILCI